MTPRFDAESAHTCLENLMAQGHSLDEGSIHDGMRVAAARCVIPVTLVKRNEASDTPRLPLSRGGA